MPLSLLSGGTSWTRLDVRFEGCSAVLSKDACPSYHRFLLRELPALQWGDRVDVPRSMWEETEVRTTELRVEKKIASVSAASFVLREKQTPDRLRLCSEDVQTEEWLLAAEGGETAKCCPVCLEPYEESRVRDSPLLSPWPSVCVHWACRDCWREIEKRGDRRCPICREDVRLALSSMFPDSSLACALRRGDEVLEDFLLHSDESNKSSVRRAASLFSVTDVIAQACRGPLPLREELEKTELSLEAATEYVVVAEGEFLVAMAPGHVILRALKTLDTERLQRCCPVPALWERRSGGRIGDEWTSDEEGGGSGTSPPEGWSLLGSLIIIHEMYALLQGQDAFHQVLLPPSNYLAMFEGVHEPIVRRLALESGREALARAIASVAEGGSDDPDVPPPSSPVT